MSDVPVYDLKGGKPQPFHLLHPSAWPLVAALSAGLLAVGALCFMHKDFLSAINFGGVNLTVGFLAVLASMWVWWRDVIHEAVVEKAHSPIVKHGFRYGMALFIVSEVMFFVAFFWAFFHAAIGSVWPPQGIEAVETFGLPFLMTMILLLSGCTVTWAHEEILEGTQAECVRALLFTVLLGVAFTGFQAYEYHHAEFAFKGGVYPSSFYMATGFHGFHVLVGSIFLAVSLWRARAGHFTAKSHFGFEAAAWYWHFVDVVWLFLFTAVYWWGNA